MTYAQLDAVLEFFFITLPQTYALFWFIHAMLGLQQPLTWRRLIIRTAAPTIYMELMFNILPTSLHLLNSVTALFVAVLLTFGRQTLKLRLFFVVLFFLSAIMSDLSIIFIASKTITYETFMSGPFYYKIPYCTPMHAAIYSLAVFLKRKQISPLKQAAHFVIGLRGKPTFYLVVLTVFQLGCINFFLVKTFIDTSVDAGLEIAIYLSLVLICFIFIHTIRLIVRTREEAIQSTQKTYIDELNQMFATVRGQRHDFINHVQVMHTMLSMNKLDRLREYMHGVADEIRTVDRAHVDHPSPALAALVEAKLTIADAKRIAFDYRIEDAPAAFGAVTSIDLVRMIGNLIDNAFDAVLSLPVGERFVLLEMSVIRGTLIISVANQGIVLTEAQRKAMIAPGYTTKEGEHSGLGLSNVAERAAQYRGTVAIESDEERGVVITIRIPNVVRGKDVGREQDSASETSRSAELS
ncbi:sensor histidine kinase [Paenibacillus xanthanilyticus]|uniref:Sensor histidine kinase n=1 Tax=Paenibacillus xanthanilyticus TaxID=1783531 RepID=A0ABV8KA04_9BACL